MILRLLPLQGTGSWHCGAASLRRFAANDSQAPPVTGDLDLEFRVAGTSWPAGPTALTRRSTIGLSTESRLVNHETVLAIRTRRPGGRPLAFCKQPILTTVFNLSWIRIFNRTVNCFRFEPLLEHFQCRNASAHEGAGRPRVSLSVRSGRATSAVFGPRCTPRASVRNDAILYTDQEAGPHLKMRPSKIPVFEKVGDCNNACSLY